MIGEKAMAKYTLYPGKSADFVSQKGTKYTVSNINNEIVCFCKGKKRKPTKEILSKFLLAGGKYTVYADGGCTINPGGNGGYGAVIVDETGTVTQLSEGFIATTNNRMEIMGAIAGIDFVPRGAEILFYSDSQYVVNTMKGKYEKSKNTDLWEKLDKAVKGKKVKFHWVRGHTGNELNEICDKLATAAMNSENLKLDEGYTGKKVLTGTKQASAMTIDIVADTKIPARGNITSLCNSCINEFYAKKGVKFKDYANLKTGGLDIYSKMSLDELKNCSNAEVEIIERYLDGKDVLTALRWHCRGLSLKDSIRKVLVDNEISKNMKRNG